MIRLVLAGFRANARAWTGVALAAALATAALVGGLLVGDALRAALDRRVDARLGFVTHRVTGPARGVAADLPERLAAHPGVVRALGAWRVPGVVATPDGRARRAWLVATPEHPVADGAVRLAPALRDALALQGGERVVLRTARPSALPREAALTQADDHLATFARRVDPAPLDTWPAGLSFDARPGEDPVALVPLGALQDVLEVGDRLGEVWVSGTAPGDALEAVWALRDADLAVEPVDGGWALTSPRVLLPPAVVDAALTLTPDATAASVWFVDSLRHGEAEIPYAFVGGLDDRDQLPLARALPPLDDHGLVLLEPVARRLGAAVGDDLTLRWPVPGAGRGLVYAEGTFHVQAVLPVDGPLADRSWMPGFDGLEGAESCRDWDPGFPVDLDRITDADEAWWDTHEGTPRAWIRGVDAEAAWSTPWGTHTAVRFPDDDDPSAALRAALPSGLAGLRAEPVRARLDAAAAPANDFGGLFVGFQVVLLTSALLLVAMIAGLATLSRAREVGTLRGVGWSRGRTTALLVGEAGLATALGTVLGLPLAALAAQVLLRGLEGAWAGATHGIGLGLVLPPATLAVGAVATTALVLGTAWLGVRSLTGRAPRDLLAGVTRDGPGPAPRGVGAVAALALLAALALPAAAPAGRTPTAVAFFFGSGALALVGGLAALRLALGRPPRRDAGGLGARGLARTPGRTVSVVALLAFGAFLVVGVGLGAARPVPDTHDRTSGSGGFDHHATLSVPVAEDLTTAEGRDPWNLPDDVAVHALRRLPGDDASCLHLGSAQVPTLLGVDGARLAAEGRFTLAEGEGLDTLAASGDGVLRAVGDTSTLTWGLHRGVGDALVFVDERGEEVRVELVGRLDDGILQGSLLVDAEALRRHWPSRAPVDVLLLDAPPGGAEAAATAYGRALEDLGIALQPTRERLEAFAEVEHTYIAIFRALGGLGLVLGAGALGVVVLRTVAERRRELALLSALGFSASRLRGLLIAEHAALLGLGLGLGTLSAGIAVLPVLGTPDVAAAGREAAAALLGTAAVGGLALAIASHWALRRLPAAVLAGR